jgi:C-8 sterol isomerase
MSRHLFEPREIHDLAVQHLGQPLEPMFDAIIGDLSARYPGVISQDQPWIFSNAGGAMIQVKFLYASLNEYLLLFGTPVGTEGHSGRHPVAFYDTVLDGEAWYYHEGQFERDVYAAGDRIFVDRGQSAGMHIPDHVWMLEYARGALGLLLPFGLADSLFSTLDYRTVRQTIAIYTRLLVRSLVAPRARQAGRGAALSSAAGLLSVAVAGKRRRARS